VTTIEGAIEFVHRQVNNVADYFKIMIEEGTLLNAPGLPMIKSELMEASVKEAPKLNMITIAHVLTVAGLINDLNCTYQDPKEQLQNNL
jgi:hypothetical protein